MPAAFYIIAEAFPTLGPNDIAPRFFANPSKFPTGNQVVPDQNINPAHFFNTSTFGANEVAEGTLALIQPSHFDNVSTFGANEVDVAPADGFIRPSSFSSGSTFPIGNEVSEAPPDEFIRPSNFTNTSTFGANQVVIDTTSSDDADEMIAGEMIGGQVI